MEHNLFNREATNRQELLSSRTPLFISIETRAAKGHYADPPLTAEEREVMQEYSALSRAVGRFEPDADSPF